MVPVCPSHVRGAGTAQDRELASKELIYPEESWGPRAVLQGYPAHPKVTPTDPLTLVFVFLVEPTPSGRKQKREDFRGKKKNQPKLPPHTAHHNHRTCGIIQHPLAVTAHQGKESSLTSPGSTRSLMLALRLRVTPLTMKGQCLIEAAHMIMKCYRRGMVK